MLDAIAQSINQNVTGAEALYEKREAGDSVIFVKGEQIFKVCEFLKKSPLWEMHVLQVITGCDFPPDTIEVSYILANFKNAQELILKVKLPRSNPRVASLCALWPAANFQERECFDMLGVVFEGHPDLRRILCPEDWEGYPLRKDYVAAKSYGGMEIYPPGKMNVADREFAAKQKAAAPSESGQPN